MGYPLLLAYALAVAAGSAVAARFGVRGPLLWGFPVGSLIGCLLVRQWLAAGTIAGALLFIGGRGWWNRRGRKAAREFGAKSRARVDALLGALRALGQPVPEGAR